MQKLERKPEISTLQHCLQQENVYIHTIRNGCYFVVCRCRPNAYGSFHIITIVAQAIERRWICFSFLFC